MKKLTALLLLGLPAGGWAMGMGWGGGGYHWGYPPPAAGHFAAVLYGLLAALGYWVLQHGAKQEKKCAMYGGHIVGWVLIVVGLLGLLCGAMSHARRSYRCCDERPGWNMQVEEQGGKSGEERTVKVQVKAEKKAPGK
ncbi:MAG: hypothetical protein M0011_02060 [Elusimicrobia bacterium]|nr:hypothetical protein [Elusimicrobiota bacterium]